MTGLLEDVHMTGIDEDVAAAGSGDEASFGKLVERHRRELHVHCYRMLGSFTDAEDLVQETFLRAWRHRNTFEGAGFRAWLYRIATNACLDAIRRNKRQLRMLNSFAPMTERLRAHFAAANPRPDATDRAAFTDHIVDAERAFAGSLGIDEPSLRKLAGRVFDRTPNPDSATNHWILEGGSPVRSRLEQVTAPTLVMHGTEDPLFPFGHAEALASEIAGTQLLPLDGVGHQSASRGCLGHRDPGAPAPHLRRLGGAGGPDRVEVPDRRRPHRMVRPPLQCGRGRAGRDALGAHRPAPVARPVGRGQAAGR